MSVDSLFGKRCPRALVRREEQLRELVDLDPRALFGHLEVAAAEACLDVGDGDAYGRRRPRTGQGRARVAVDQHLLGSLFAHDVLDPAGHRLHVGRPQVELVGGRAETELLEEDRRELAIPVLARMQHHLRQSDIGERSGERR